MQIRKIDDSLHCHSQAGGNNGRRWGGELALSGERTGDNEIPAAGIERAAVILLDQRQRADDQNEEQRGNDPVTDNRQVFEFTGDRYPHDPYPCILYCVRGNVPRTVLSGKRKLR